MLSPARFPLCCLAVLLLASIATLLSAAAPPLRRGPIAGQQRSRRLSPPLIFEQNVGQSASSVDFLARGQGYAFGLTATEAQLGLRRFSRSRHGVRSPMEVAATQVTTRLLGANTRAQARGEKRLRAKINYFSGNDRSKWLTDVPAYERVRTAAVYPGIDLVHYGREDGALEYDFEVAPGADPDQIRFTVEGAKEVSVDEAGDLVLTTGSGQVRQRKPVCYQRAADRNIPVEGGFRVAKRERALSNKGEAILEVTFRLSEYDRSLPLTIDPVLVYSTYLGGSSLEIGNAIAAGPDGRAYVTGEVQFGDFPVKGAFDGPDESPGRTIYDAFVSVLDPSKSGADSLEYSTYLSGIQDDIGTVIGVDQRGRAVAGGFTASGTLFPTTDIPYLPDQNDAGGWLAVLDPKKSGAESLVFSMRSVIVPASLAIAPSGKPYIVGTTASSHLSGTVDAFQTRLTGKADVAFAIINTEGADGQAFHYLSYLGGSERDSGVAVDVDSDGRAYLLGHTESDDFPRTDEAFQDTRNPGAADLFVTILDPSQPRASALIYSTYLGGNDLEWGADLARDPLGRIVIGGATDSPDFPTTPTRWSGPEGNIESTDSYGFLAILDIRWAGAGALVYSTCMPGAPNLRANGTSLKLAADASGRVYVANSMRRARPDEAHRFLATFDPSQSGESSLYSMEFVWHIIRSLVIGPSRRLYLTGAAGVDQIATTPSRFQDCNGLGDAFVMVTEPIQTADPTDLTAVPLSSTKIQLTWMDHANDEAGFHVERRSPNGTFVQIGSVGPNVKSYTDTGLSPGAEYTYRVCYFKTGHASRYTNLATAKTLALPATPSEFTATTVSSTRILLKWSYADEETISVQIERKVGSGGFTVIASVQPTVVSFVNSGLTPLTKYTYRLRAIRGPDVSPYTNEATATTLPVPPAPTDLTATAISSSQIELKWSAQIGAEVVNETRFEVERKNASGSFIKVATVPGKLRTFVDQGLAPVSTHTYRVRTVNAIGTSPYSEEASATTKSEDIIAPSDLEANAPSQRTIALFWRDNSPNETGFKLERSTNGVDFVQVKTLAADVVETTDTGLSPNTKYWYRIRAHKDVEVSAYSNVVSLTSLPLPPTAPTNLTAEPQSAQKVLLRWKDESNDETRFRLEMRLESNGFRDVANLPANTQTWTTGVLDSNRSYSFRVRAQNTGGFSAYSNVVSALTTPVPMSGLAVAVPADPTGRTRLDLSWTDPNSAPVKAKVTRSKGGTVEKTVTLNAGVTLYADTGLTPATTYRYAVVALNGSGESAALQKDGTTLPVPPPPPAAPDSLTCTILGPTSAELKWSDRSADENGFKIERAAAGGSFTQVASVAANTVRWKDTRLAPSTAYRFRLRAYRGNDHSAYSIEASGTTPQPPPNAPGSLAAKAVGADRVDLTWTDRSNNEDTFHVERAPGEADFAEIGTTGAGKTAFADQDVEPATTYRYRVRAKNSSGFSAYSGIASATVERLVRGKLEVSGSLEFGKVKVGKLKSLTLTLRNASASERLSLNVGALGKPFKVISGGGQGVLEPKGIRSVVVTFQPRKAKKFKDALPIVSSDPAKLNTQVAAKGNGK